MPARLLIVARPQGHGQASLQALHAATLLAQAGYVCHRQAPGLEIWCAGRPPPIAEGPYGSVLVGRLVAAPGPAAPSRRLGPHEPLRAARELVRSAWGSYLAVWRDRDGRWWVLRDPSGALDALTWSRGPLALLATSLEGLPPQLRPPQLALDWDVLAGLIAEPAGLTGASALQGLVTVAPGSLHPFGGPRGEGRLLWRPQDHASAATGLEADPELPDRLRACVDACVAGVLPPDGALACEISGGLDSAIVAGSLAAQGFSGRIALAINYRADLPESDERVYARAVADRAGLALSCRRKSPGSLSERDFAELACGARPALNALDPERDRSTATLLRRAGAAALLTGKGGDAVFLQNTGPVLLSDLARLRGPAALVGREAEALARGLRRSVWSCARDALRLEHVVLHSQAAGLWGERVRAAPRLPRHSWLEALEALAPGKRLQVLGLTLAQVHRGPNRHSRDAEVLHPLLAQPLVELCLSIPTWRLAAGGRDRALARQAHADRLPPLVRERRSKGDLTAFYGRRIAAGLDFLRPYLLDGALAGAGVLDRAAVERTLQPDALIAQADPSPILTAAAVEAWVRYWQGQAPGVAAARP
jgi:asparagine synthase (glutamine-hydrolysing)